MKLFFFSSRRRHTRWPRDWSSDVCSSDLAPRKVPIGIGIIRVAYRKKGPHFCSRTGDIIIMRSEEHTSELQSRGHLVCRLLLEKKKKKKKNIMLAIGRHADYVNPQRYT